MKRFVCCALLLLSCSSAWAQSSFIDSPAQCFSKMTYPCSLRAVGNFLSFERSSQAFHLNERSAILFLSATEVQLLQGQVWIRDSSALEVKVTSALKISVTGEWFVEKLPDATTLFRNLNGEAKFQSKYVFKNESLPLGFQNWYGGLTTNGEIARGVIRPILLTDFLKVWIPVSGLSFAEAKKRTHEYREIWHLTLEQSSEFYQQVINRRLASQSESLQRTAQKQKAQAGERARLRQMYLEKNGL
jgi:hypothetical protein